MLYIAPEWILEDLGAPLKLSVFQLKELEEEPLHLILNSQFIPFPAIRSAMKFSY